MSSSLCLLEQGESYTNAIWWYSWRGTSGEMVIVLLLLTFQYEWRYYIIVQSQGRFKLSKLDVEESLVPVNVMFEGGAESPVGSCVGQELATLERPT